MCMMRCRISARFRRAEKTSAVLWIASAPGAPERRIQSGSRRDKELVGKELDRRRV